MSLADLLLKLVSLIRIEVKVMLETLDILLLLIQVLIVLLSLLLQGLVDLHEVVVEGHKLFHLGQSILRDSLMRLLLILVGIVYAS